MTNKEKAVSIFGYDPFKIRYTNNPVYYTGATGTQQYGPIWLIPVNGKWYSFQEWLQCGVGKLPATVYCFNSVTGLWVQA